MGSTITIEYCDIEKVPTKCIVNAANSRLQYGSGVCHAVFTGAGVESMTQACNEIGYCDVGKAVVTKAFHLPADWVIHAVGPYTSDPNATELLRSAYISAMEIVQKKDCHKVSFPLISSGVFNDAEIDYEALWRVAITAIMDYQKEHPDYPIDVLFACHGRTRIETGKQVLASLSTLPSFMEKTLPRTTQEEIKRHRIYVSKMGGFHDSSNFVFIAEFESQKLASNYVKYMRGKAHYRDKDIIVQELAVSCTSQSETITKGKIIAVITVLGESLPVEEIEFI